MSKGFSRRAFLKGTTVAGLLGALSVTGLNKPLLASENREEKLGTLMDLTKCDGCANYETPLCVQACRQKNQARYPEPVKPIKDYWPQKKHEDWSDKRDLTNRLTPYNWTFVDEVTVEHNGVVEKVFIPRRCMHCDNPTCMNLCPFSAISKENSGAIVINDQICMGGGKCRDVCPWGIPQRQAGVGLYLKVAPDLAGGGVMYKCDLCHDLLAQGREPACVEACPNKAITIGPKKEIQDLAYSKAQAIDGYIYGDKENGGTSTFYISKVPFEKIHQAIMNDKKEKNDTSPGRPGMPVNVGNYLDTEKGLFYSALIAPIAGIAAAGFTAYKTMTKDKEENDHGQE